MTLLNGDGNPEARNEGASLEHYSLCRCGKSQKKPFCSGMHWYSDFHDPPPADQATLFQWAGGFPALLRLTRRFYERHIPEEPLLAGLFSQMSPDHPERVAAWLGQVFGGPPAYSDRYGEYDRMISQHLDKRLTLEQRGRWVALLSPRRTRSDFRPTPNSAPPSRPTWSGGRESPLRTRSPECTHPRTCPCRGGGYATRTHGHACTPPPTRSPTSRRPSFPDPMS